MRQLVADDALELLAIELLEEAGRDRDTLACCGSRPVAKALGAVSSMRYTRASGRSPRCHLADHVHELGRVVLVDLAGARCGEDELSPAKYDRRRPATATAEDHAAMTAPRQGRPGQPDMNASSRSSSAQEQHRAAATDDWAIC